MTGKIYHLPVGLLNGFDASSAISAGEALPLAGGPVAFSAVVVRTREGVQERLSAHGWSGKYPDEAGILCAMRNPVAGLTMDHPRIMGILNLTPDSFSDGGTLGSLEDVLARASDMAEEGADILDIGGESTRPGSDTVPAEEELERVLPAISALAELELRDISIDSRKPEVFEAAIKAGASIINDVSALTYDNSSAKTAAGTGAPVVLMHAQGDPKTMQDDPVYDHCLFDVYDWLEARMEACMSDGIQRESLVLDPGIGFGKRLRHNLELLHGLALFHNLGCPLLLGASRKRFINEIYPSPDPKNRQGGSLAAVAAGASRGVQIFRVHDVRETAEFLAVQQRLVRPIPPMI